MTTHLPFAKAKNAYTSADLPPYTPMDAPGSSSGAACSPCSVCKLAWILLLIGGLNWGLVGLGGFLGTNLNVVNLVVGNWPMVENGIYVLVGLSAVGKALKCCKCCKK